MKHFWHRVHFIAWTILVLVLGYFLGTFTFALEKVIAPAPITLLPHDARPRRSPIVHVEEINDGNIIGMVGTGARLIIGNEAVVPRPDRSFAVPARPFLVNIIDVPIPRSAQFVASRRGRKYYPVDSSAGQRLVPENRLYFRTAEEAEALGYERGK